MVSNPHPPNNPSKKSFNLQVRSRYNKTKKIYDMLNIIKNNITHEMRNGFHSINLEYLDIKLDFYIDFGEIDDKHIYINAFSRSHYVRLHPEHRIMHAPAQEGNPASSKGDGALFLALTVLYCNKILGDIPYWIGGVTDWWRIKGVCTIEKACVKTDRSRHAFEINNTFFIDWSLQILDNHTSNHQTVYDLLNELFADKPGSTSDTKILGGKSNSRKKNRKTLKKIKKNM